VTTSTAKGTTSLSKTPNPPKTAATQASVVEFKAALRKAKRKNAREPEIDFLNITAMLDLMTIILVFVLKSASASTASIPQNADLQLPTSVLTAEPGEEGVMIRISKTQITVGDETEPVVEYSDRAQLAQTGIDARYKQEGPNSLIITPLAQVLQRYRTNDRVIREAKGKDASTSEAIIIADETTPYRLLTEVLFTAGMSEFGKYHLLVRQGQKK
jgi:biopolymer transport protein ExbD